MCQIYKKKFLYFCTYQGNMPDSYPDTSLSDTEYVTPSHTIPGCAIWVEKNVITYLQICFKFNSLSGTILTCGW
jgi:hypothetical protein